MVSMGVCLTNSQPSTQTSAVTLYGMEWDSWIGILGMGIEIVWNGIFM